MLTESNDYRLAAYTIAYDAEKHEMATTLYPVPPVYKEMTDALAERSSEHKPITVR
jgi:hypothetical protein